MRKPAKSNTPQTPPNPNEIPAPEATKVKKPFYKRWWFILIVAIVLIGVIANIFGDADQDKTSETPSDDSSTSVSSEETTEEPSEEVPEEEAPEEHEFTVGQDVPVGDMIFKVTSVEVVDNLNTDYSETTPIGDKFVLVNLDLTNNGNEQTTISSSFFKLLNGDITYETDSNADTALIMQDRSFFLTEINPGLTASGTVAFDLPADAADPAQLVLQVQTGVFGTETGEIKLGG